MEIDFNGKRLNVSGARTLVEILELHSIDKHTGGVAIAVNGRIVFRPNWTFYMVQDGDCIEVVHAVQGG
jgi:sulfur carrier protein